MAAARESAEAEAAVNANEQAARDTSKWRRWRCRRLRASTLAPQAPAPETPAPEAPAPETPPPGCVYETLALAIMLFGSESWCLPERLLQQLRVCCTLAASVRMSCHA